jgi:hypothetical protein
MISNTIDYIVEVPMNRKKPPTRPFNIRIPLDLLERMESAAHAEDRSVNYLAIRCLEQCYPEKKTTTDRPDRATETKADYADRPQDTKEG